MASQATINPTPDQAVIRNIGRVKTLRDAIAKSEARGKSEKVASLQAELDRRMAELNELKAALESL
jgi:hypothetical protein